MFKLLDVLLRRLVRHGALTVIDARGSTSVYGDGSGAAVTVKLMDTRIARHLAVDPELALGEGYMDGRVVMVEGRIYDLLALLLSNSKASHVPGWSATASTSRTLLRRLKQFNPRRRAARNVQHHYDITGAIYDLFLDRDRQYSCAYFTPGADLEAAQRAKMRHIASKLCLAPGQRILDIGCGWGGLALYLARVGEGDVTGITLSREQHRIAATRAAAEGLSRRVSVRREDYRDLTGTYDRIVSVGMFEHVGINHYVTYFRQLRALLATDGVALLHTIGRADMPCATNPFIAKYIFPGGCIPALSEVVAAAEKAGLIVTDVEVLRLHYAETLRAWRERFLAHWNIAADLKDERFCRMWEFYLAGSETAFRYQDLVVFQIQLAREIAAMPLTRDYMHEAERALAVRETEILSARAGGQ